METISNILEDIKVGTLFPKIHRQKFNYNIEKAREIVLAIGRAREANFAIDSTNIFAYDNFIKWLMGDPTMEALDPDTRLPVPGRLSDGIYVAGGTGTGKSWLLEIMAALCLIDKPVLLIGEEKRPLRWQNYRTDLICDEFTASGTVERFKQATVLGIQDLGSEPRESLYMGNRVPVLRSIIESRGDRTDCITMISSNYPINHPALEEIYGSRAVSRLASMCNYFEIRGDDRRKRYLKRF